MGTGETSKIRHSSAGWNPVHRIFKNLDGLGPSLRWDDGVFSSSQFRQASVDAGTRAASRMTERPPLAQRLVPAERVILL